MFSGVIGAKCRARGAGPALGGCVIQSVATSRMARGGWNRRFNLAGRGADQRSFWGGRSVGSRGGCYSLVVCAILLLNASHDLVAGELEQNPTAANAPVRASEATARIKVPEGFTVTQFAAEPDVVQPIAMTIDHKGRLWVVENYAYPLWLGGPTGKDRILIFEDTDNDGRFDRRTVFFDRGTNFTGIELGFGGVWICSTPELAVFSGPRRRRPPRWSADYQARRLEQDAAA